MSYKKQLLKTLASTTILSAVLLAGAQVDAKDVTVQHVELASLTDQEKTLVTPGTPTISEKDLVCNYVLVYQPKTSTQAGTAQLLPSTGSLETDLAVYGMGLSGLSLAGYLIYKNKKTGRHMLIALLIAGGIGSATTAQADWKLLLPQETITVAVNGQFAVTPQTIEGYEYVGYIADDSCDKPVPTPSHKDTYEPTTTPITVSLGTPLTADDIKAAVTIPTGSNGTITKVEAIPATTAAGVATPAKVTITYPDGTEDVIEVLVTITNTAPTATATDATGKVGVATDLTASVTATDTEDDKSDADSLNKTISYKVTDPAGVATSLTADEAKAFTPATAGDYTIEVTVTDSQGETATATYILTVAPLDKDLYDPTTTGIVVPVGTVITEDDVKGKVTIPAGSNGVIETVGTIPTTDTEGEKAGVVVTVKYPDGTTDEVTVPVTVTEQTEFAPLARDYFGQSDVITPNYNPFIPGDKELVRVDILDNATYEFLDRYYEAQNLFLDQPIHMGKLIADRFQDDPRDKQPDQLKEVKITTSPLYGKLVLVDAAAGTVVDAGDTIQASDLDKLYLVNLATQEDREYGDDDMTTDQRIAMVDQLGELQATGKLASLGLTTETVNVAYLESAGTLFDHIGYQFVDTGSAGFNTSATEMLTFGYYPFLQ